MNKVSIKLKKEENRIYIRRLGTTRRIPGPHAGIHHRFQQVAAMAEESSDEMSVTTGLNFFSR